MALFDIICLRYSSSNFVSLLSFKLLFDGILLQIIQEKCDAIFSRAFLQEILSGQLIGLRKHSSPYCCRSYKILINI